MNNFQIVRKFVILALFMSCLAVPVLIPVSASELWTVDTVDNTTDNTGRFSSLVVDGTGDPYIGYLDTRQGELCYAVKEEGKWQIERIEYISAGDWCRLSLAGKEQDPCMLSMDETGNTLVLFTRNASIWQKEYPPTGGNIANTPAALAGDRDGYPHIVCVRQTSCDLYYLWKNARGWHSEPVAHSTGGWNPSLALDNESRPHISYAGYQDPGQYHLVYTFRNTSGWHSERVDGSPDTGWAGSLALNKSGYPRISYYNRESGDLYYAERQVSGWDVSVVDTLGDVGNPSILSLDPDGFPHIVYANKTSNSLKYSWKDISGWHTEPVIRIGAGWSGCFVLDSMGNPHISYPEYPGDHLAYATRSGSPGGPRFTIRASSSEGGQITPSGTIPVLPGGTISLALLPDAGYVPDRVVIDGEPVPIRMSYLFPAIDRDHTVTVSFRPDKASPPPAGADPLHPGVTFQVCASAGQGGVIRPAGMIEVISGANLSFSIVPDFGYRNGNLSLDGRPRESGRSYTLTNISSNHTVHAIFLPNHYSVTASAGTGGTIQPAGLLMLSHGANQTFVITPGAGYCVHTVSIDGKEDAQPALGDYSRALTISLCNITSDHRISAEFSPIMNSGLYITSNPSSAYVYCDGTLKGRTPLQLTDLRDGEHQFRVVLTGYKDWRDTIRTMTGEVVTADVQLTPITSLTGTIYVLSLPEGADILLDGKTTGRITPSMVNDIPAGSHIVRVQKPGYTPYEQSVDVRDSLITRFFGLLVRIRAT